MVRLTPGFIVFAQNNLHQSRLNLSQLHLKTTTDLQKLCEIISEPKDNWFDLTSDQNHYYSTIHLIEKKIKILNQTTISKMKNEHKVPCVLNAESAVSLSVKKNWNIV